MTGWTWAEPFAGAAACALRLVGGRDLDPPVAWMGGKRRYARTILDAMGVPEAPPSRVLLADAGPWGWVWPLLLEPECAKAVADWLRHWSSEHPRDLWARLAAVPPYEDLSMRAAQWLWLQARSASGVPILWDGWRHVQSDHDTGRVMVAGQSGRGWAAGSKAATDKGEDLRWPGHQAERDRWEKGTPAGRPPQDATNGQRGALKASDGRGEARAAGARAVGGKWAFGGRGDRQQKERPAAMSGDKALASWRMGEEQKKSRRGTRTISEKGAAAGRTGGMVNPGTIADRIEAIARAFSGAATHVHHGDAGGIEASGGPTWCYLDPPYVGATGYGWDLPRAEVLNLALRWADHGAVVAVSEAERLDLPGWYAIDLTREGGKPEWLTLSRAPARLPMWQASMFAEGP